MIRISGITIPISSAKTDGEASTGTGCAAGAASALADTRTRGAKMIEGRRRGWMIGIVANTGWTMAAYRNRALIRFDIRRASPARRPVESRPA